MKLFTLKATWHVAAAAGGMHPVVVSWPEQYPQPKDGIVLDESDRTIVLGWTKRIKCSPELLQLDPSSGAIARDGKRVTLYRASISMESGEPVLVPERPEDAADALVLLDVGRARSLNINYKMTDEQKVASVVIDGGRLNGRDEHVLARMKRFESILLYRSDLKWILWGKEYVKEILDIKFDGDKIFYEVVTPPRQK